MRALLLEQEDPALTELGQGMACRLVPTHIQTSKTELHGGVGVGGWGGVGVSRGGWGGVGWGR